MSISHNNITNSSSPIISSSDATLSSHHNPLHIQFREWELGPNNTIWDNLRAAPSDEDILWQWGLLVGLSIFALVGILIVFLGILSDPRCRKNSFNVYILFLMVPDLLFTTLGLMTTSLNLANGSFFNMTHCLLQSYYSVFTVTASSWLNAILARQLHAMLRASNSHRRYKAPTRRKAMKHGAIVFLWSAFIASWALWPLDWWPIRTELYSGAFCLPMAYDETSMAFLYLVFAPCCFVLPFLYICYVVIDILYKRLLPPKEKRQRLLIFFGLIITYFFIWVPTIVLTYILGYWMSSWYTYFGAVWGVSQGFISAAVCLLKADIQKAVKKFVGYKGKNDDGTERGRNHTGIDHSESYIHTSIFGLEGNSIHSVASSVVDLSSLRDPSRLSNNSQIRNSSGGSHHRNNRSQPRRSSNNSLGSGGSFLANSTILSTSFQTGGGYSTTGTSNDSIGPFESNRSDDMTIFEIDEDKLLLEESSQHNDKGDDSSEGGDSFANEEEEENDGNEKEDDKKDQEGFYDEANGDGQKDEEQGMMMHHSSNHSQDVLSSSFRSIGMDGKITSNDEVGSQQDNHDGPILKVEGEQMEVKSCVTLESSISDDDDDNLEIGLPAKEMEVTDETKQHQEHDLSAMEEGNGVEEKKLDEHENQR